LQLKLFLSASAAVVKLATGALPSAADDQVVYRNKRLVDPDTLYILELRYGYIPGGAYWYDAYTGSTGHRGGPTSGLIATNLPLGPLPPDPSNRNTGVFLNGRELPGAELSVLQELFGPILHGRYWVTADRMAGREGDPAQWNVQHHPSRAQTTTGTRGGGGGAIHSEPMGTVVSVDGCFYYDGRNSDYLICK
jgi:hypothetical protein